MILIEFLKNLFWLICRFFVWFFTLRDCEHCDLSYENWWKETRCSMNCEKRDECKKTIHRKHFKRGRWFA